MKGQSLTEGDDGSLTPTIENSSLDFSLSADPWLQESPQLPYDEGKNAAAPDALTDSTDSGGEASPDSSPMRFTTRYIDFMEMYADVATVTDYFDGHQGWFTHCAAPMKVEPIGATGYALTIGRFGAFGYNVEPKIGLDLIPPENGRYRIVTIPVPDYTPPGYEVDFQSSMELLADDRQDWPVKDRRTGQTVVIPQVTKVRWHLDLVVTIQFPRFIYRLSRSLLQKTGDNLLHQIVRQVSHSLTRKVQHDFHQARNLPIPMPRKR